VTMEIGVHLKQTIRDALLQYRGDDLNRARAAFRGLSPKQMQQQHGQSGKTRAQILEGYEQHVRNVEEAVAWLDRQQA
jgi:hypothetical protein